MNRKLLYKRIIVATSIFGITLALYPFIASMGMSARAKNDGLISISLPALREGIIEKIWVGPYQVFFLKPNKDQKKSIITLDSHVWDRKITSFNRDLGAYVYLARSTKWGSRLNYKPPHESTLVVWDESAKWLGGYWDNHSEISYDLAGRAIKTPKYTFNGYNAEFPNLETPVLIKGKGQNYLISKLPRK